MGRTILSATQTWVEEEKALSRFVRALRKSDRILVEELIALSRSHIAEASYASNLYPMDIYLVSMLLELYKKVQRLEIQVEQLGGQVEGAAPVVSEVPGVSSLLELVAHTDAVEKKEGGPSVDVAGTEYVDLQEGA
jgi:hypothetical protein